jgi:ABC-type dipeptide/oligopeptide/nickel transport system permease component
MASIYGAWLAGCGQALGSGRGRAGGPFSIAGGALPYMHFSSAGLPSIYGSWGAYEYTGAPLAASPRAQALVGAAILVNTTSQGMVGEAPLDLALDALPVSALVLGSFATSTFLTKNSFLDEIRKQYVLTARMKGLNERQVLYGHVFRNAMMIVIAGFPGAFVSAFFTGSLLIENIFSLDGLGLLTYESVMNRDYPVVFANIYILALLGLVVNLISDLTYTWIDPRIDFETREV